MEQNVLGAMLIDRDAAETAFETLRPEDFYSTKHRLVFEAALAVWGSTGSVDAPLLRTELRRRIPTNETQWDTMICDLAASVGSAAHLEAYAQHVKNCSVSRQIIAAATEVIRLGLEPGHKTSDLLEEAERTILGISLKSEGDGISTADQMMGDLSQTLESDGVPKGLMCGLSVFDDLIGGLRPGELTVLAARPNVGKTTLALNVIRNLAENGTPVLFFSLEMNKRTIAMHLTRRDTGLDPFRSGLDRKKIEQICSSAQHLRTLPFLVRDGHATIRTIASNTRRTLRRQNPPALVVVDYLQRVSPANHKDSRTEQVSTIARGLKNIAESCHVHLLALCQLNRESERRDDRLPRLEDLRNSGEIEQEADSVILLHRPNMHSPLGDDGSLICNLVKSRNTPVGSCSAFLLLARGLVSNSYDLSSQDASVVNHVKSMA